MRLLFHQALCGLLLSAGAAFAQAPAEKVPSAAAPSPAIPSPAIPQPSIAQPAIPQPAIPQPAIPSPAIPSPTTGDATPRELPPDPAELAAAVSEGDVVGRCLPEVTLGDAAMPFLRDMWRPAGLMSPSMWSASDRARRRHGAARESSKKGAQ